MDFPDYQNYWKARIPEYAHLEVFPACLTLGGLLASVDSLVLNEVNPLVVAFSTLPTFKRFLFSVDPPLLNEVWGLEENLPAVTTSAASFTVQLLLLVIMWTWAQRSFLPWIPSGIHLPPLHHVLQVTDFARFWMLNTVLFCTFWGHQYGSAASKTCCTLRSTLPSLGS